MTRHPPRNCRPGRNPPRPRSGSILLIASGILVCMFIFALGYSRFLSRQSAMADRMIKQQRLGTLASAIATLAAHKLQFGAQTMLSASDMPACPVESTPLKAVIEYLARPLSQFETSRQFELPLYESATAHFALVLGDLWQAAGYGGELVSETSLIVNRSDFSATGPAPDAYTREKTGCIRIRVALRLVTGGVVRSSAEFDYSCPVRITTVHAPVLSKFNLYVEDAALAPGDVEADYNQVSVNQLGNLAESTTKAVPLVLNNDDNLNLPVKRELRNFIEDPRGLVYLGGAGKLFLNLARSDAQAPTSDSGEAFQFFRVPGIRGDGFAPIDVGHSPEFGKLFVSHMEQGVSDDPDPRIAQFLSCIESGQIGKRLVSEGRMRLASIFRLFGTQRKPSPTLVLGNVLSRYLSISLLTGETGSAFLPQLLQSLSYFAPMTPPPYYADLIDQPGYAALRQGFGLDGSTTSYMKYIKTYASSVRFRPYNQGLIYIDSQNDANAIQAFPESDPLGAFVRRSEHPAAHAVPAPFAQVYPSVPDLKGMSELLTPAVGLARASYRFENAGGEDPVELMKAQSLVSRGRLALNGWATFSSGVRISRPLEYLSNAGLIVEHGDIIVAAAIRPVGHKPNAVLGLVALDGDVIFDNEPGDAVQASAIAYSNAPDRGRVVFKRPPASIRGALAMKKLVRNADEAETFRGTGLTYFSPFAALPAGSDGVSGDAGLLSLSFGQHPQELR